MPPLEPGPPDAEPDVPVGLPRVIGGYEIQRVLGSGGMATVYAALQRQPRRTVAVKVMRSTAHADVAMRRFKREIEILGRLRHPFIAQVYGAGVHDDGGGAVPYFVMEYVPGARTIVEYADHAKLDQRERLKLFVKVCAAVEHGHRNKIIHRDLKPGNILIDEAGDPKIIDYGVARAIDLDVAAQTQHTEEGRLIGTIRYMAPEQLDTTRQDLDARCDVYALGVLLYRLLTGRPPHDVAGLPLFTAAQVIREDEPPRPSTVRPDLKGDLETIVLRALAKDRTQRYRGAGSLGRDIVRLLAHKPIKAREASMLHRLGLLARRRRVETRAAAVVVVVVLVAVAVVIYQNRVLRPRTPGGEPDATADPPTATPARDPDQPHRTPPLILGDPAPSTPPASGGPDPEMPEGFTLEGGHEGEITALAFDPAGRYLASAGEDLHVAWWDLAEQRVVLRTADHDTRVAHLAFSGDGAWLASAAQDGSVVVVAREGEGSRVIERTRLPGVLALAIAPDGALLAAACPDMTLRLLTLAGREHARLRSTTGPFGVVAFDTDGGLVVAGSERAGVYAWDAADGSPWGQETGGVGPMLAIGVDADRRLVAVDAAGTARIWSLDGEGDVITVETDLPEVDFVSLSADARWLVRVGAEAVQAIDLRTGNAIDSPLPPEAEEPPTQWRLSPDGRWCATGHETGLITMTPVPGRWIGATD